MWICKGRQHDHQIGSSQSAAKRNAAAMANGANASANNVDATSNNGALSPPAAPLIVIDPKIAVGT
jgi:hypothetical protein